MSEKIPGAWIKSIYSNEWNELLLRIAMYKYSQLPDVDGLMEEGRQELCIKLDKRAKDPDKTQGTLSEAYIVSSFKTSMVEVLRKRNGRPTPREWLSAHGEIGKLLFELVCLLRMKLAEILADAGGLAPPDPLIETTPRELVIYLFNEIERKRECDAWQRGEVSIHGDEKEGQPGIELPDESGRTARDKLVIEQIIHILLHGDVNAEHSALRSVAERIRNCREQVGGKLDLSDEQRFILIACYLEKLEDKQTAIFVGISVRSVRYQRKLALKKLTDLVGRCGLTSWNDLFE